jgi:hypothetical protein
MKKRAACACLVWAESLFLINSGLAWATAPNLPLPGVQAAGQGTLRFLGLDIYRARLWVSPGFQPEDYAARPLALELTYLRGFPARAIAERSIAEMRRVGRFSDAQAARWQQALQDALPDVKAGDRLTGLHRPGVGALFQIQGRPVGEIADPEFSRLFFGIWLSAATSEPRLREALLPQASGTAP